MQLEAVYLEALLYLLYYFLVGIRITFLLFSATKNILPENFVVKERGKIIVKGKGELLTYWMEYKPNRLPPPKNKVSISDEIRLFKFDITLGPHLMRIHLVQYSTSVRYEKYSNIHLVRPIIHLVQNSLNANFSKPQK